jgi:hypothetical protein
MVTYKTVRQQFSLANFAPPFGTRKCSLAQATPMVSFQVFSIR